MIVPDPGSGLSEDMSHSIETALESLRSGELVAIADDSHRENEVDLVQAAQLASSDSLAFMIRHTSGIICVALPSCRADDLSLFPMTTPNTDPRKTAFTISVDAQETGTGVSAADRARTIRTLADPLSRSEDFKRPGHVFPLRANDGGLVSRRGHTEAGSDLVRLAGLRPYAAIAELMNPDGTTARPDEALRFAEKHGITLLSVDQIARFRLRVERLVEQASKARLPTVHGDFTAYAFSSRVDGTEHIALLREPLETSLPVLVRIQSECLTGEVFGSTRCDCHEQLDVAFDLISRKGGILIYLRGHEGRGIGLVDKLRAYDLQDCGLDTVEANLALGLPSDARQYWVAGHILAKLGISSIRLLTNNPEKVAQVSATGIRVVERLPILSPIRAQNASYLRTKQTKLGHIFSTDSITGNAPPSLRMPLEVAPRQRRQLLNGKRTNEDPLRGGHGGEAREGSSSH